MGIQHFHNYIYDTEEQRFIIHIEDCFFIVCRLEYLTLHKTTRYYYQTL